MTEREHIEINERLKAAEETRYRQQVEGLSTAGRLMDKQVLELDGARSSGARDAIRSEIHRLTGRIEQLKALDGCLPRDLSPMAEDAVRTLVLGGVR